MPRAAARAGLLPRVFVWIAGLVEEDESVKGAGYSILAVSRAASIYLVRRIALAFGLVCRANHQAGCIGFLSCAANRGPGSDCAAEERGGVQRRYQRPFVRLQFRQGG